MHNFIYQDDHLYCQGVSVSHIVEQVGTPVYIYSYETLIDHFQKLDAELSELNHLICYSVKTNSNIAVCRALIKAGAGVDIVSGGELYRVKQAGVKMNKVIYAGVGKTEAEITQAIEDDILFFTVESRPELKAIDTVAARLGKKARVALRVNPDVESDTHAYITTGKKENKFGIDENTAFAIYEKKKDFPAIDFVGIHMHIGSQITSEKPYLNALDKMIPLIHRVKKKAGVDLKYFDLGGGLGIIYDQEQPMDAKKFAGMVVPRLKDLNMQIIVEPGRFIAGNAGILVTKVLYVKGTGHKNFIIVDGGMNDLIRPSLYEAYHKILPVVSRREEETLKCDVVGPICESGDFFAKDRILPPVAPDDLLAIMSAGAYGFTMSSNYNSRLRAAEVLVKGKEFFVIRERETYTTLTQGERIPGFLL